MTKKQKLKELRRHFHDAVFFRDSGCKVCGEKRVSEVYDAHHITNRNDIPSFGYVLSNGIRLCSDCHVNAENEYFNEETDDSHRDWLYSLIGSSYETAVVDCEKLEKTLDFSR